MATMTVRAKTGIWLAMSMAAACAAVPPSAAHGALATEPADKAIDERALHAGGNELLIEVVGMPRGERSDELQRWAAEAANATLTAFGRFPLPNATVRVEQIDSRDPSPVPWGQTLRRDDVSVLLYVRRNAGLEELREDWTAVHELSHLFHPFLGGQGRWLAEGLASYYQNVLRARAGLMTQAEAWKELDAGFGRGRRERSGERLDELSRRHRGTMRVYWAGAAYWLEADLALRQRGSSLDAVLSTYSGCCLRGTGQTQPEDFVDALDRAGGGGVFRGLFDRYSGSREFPALDGAYRELGLQSGENGLVYSRKPEAARLRRDIMGAGSSSREARAR